MSSDISTPVSPDKSGSIPPTHNSIKDNGKTFLEASGRLISNTAIKLFIEPVRETANHCIVFPSKQIAITIARNTPGLKKHKWEKPELFSHRKEINNELEKIKYRVGKRSRETSAPTKLDRLITDRLFTGIGHILEPIKYIVVDLIGHTTLGTISAGLTATGKGVGSAAKSVSNKTAKPLGHLAKKLRDRLFIGHKVTMLNNMVNEEKVHLAKKNEEFTSTFTDKAVDELQKDAILAKNEKESRELELQGTNKKIDNVLEKEFGGITIENSKIKSIKKDVRLKLTSLKNHKDDLEKKLLPEANLTKEAFDNKHVLVEAQVEKIKATSNKNTKEISAAEEAKNTAQTTLDKEEKEHQRQINSQIKAKQNAENGKKELEDAISYTSQEKATLSGKLAKPKKANEEQQVQTNQDLNGITTKLETAQASATAAQEAFDSYNSTLEKSEEKTALQAIAKQKLATASAMVEKLKAEETKKSSTLDNLKSSLKAIESGEKQGLEKLDQYLLKRLENAELTKKFYTDSFKKIATAKAGKEEAAISLQKATASYNIIINKTSAEGLENPELIKAQTDLSICERKEKEADAALAQLQKELKDSNASIRSLTRLYDDRPLEEREAPNKDLLTTRDEQIKKLEETKTKFEKEVNRLKEIEKNDSNSAKLKIIQEAAKETIALAKKVTTYYSVRLTNLKTDSNSVIDLLNKRDAVIAAVTERKADLKDSEPEDKANLALGLMQQFASTIAGEKAQKLLAKSEAAFNKTSLKFTAQPLEEDNDDVPAVADEINNAPPPADLFQTDEAPTPPTVNPNAEEDAEVVCDTETSEPNDSNTILVGDEIDITDPSVVTGNKLSNKAIRNWNNTAKVIMKYAEELEKLANKSVTNDQEKASYIFEKASIQFNVATAHLESMSSLSIKYSAFVEITA